LLLHLVKKHNNKLSHRFFRSLLSHKTWGRKTLP